MAFTLTPESTAVFSDISCDDDLDEDQDTCWLCLNGPDQTDAEHQAASQELVAPCSCPRKCHPSCLATWQLHRAGTEEEHTCRFCNARLPDWKGVLLATARPAQARRPETSTLMCIVHGGKKHYLRVTPGQSQQAFVQQLQAITGMSESEIQALNMTFNTTAPHTAQPLALSGLGAFNAALHCAAASVSSTRARSSTGGGRCGRAVRSLWRALRK